MADPVLGIKCACVLLCISVILYILVAVAKTIRVTRNKLFASNIEAVLMILLAFFIVLVPISLLWSAIAWLII